MLGYRRDIFSNHLNKLNKKCCHCQFQLPVLLTTDVTEKVKIDKKKTQNNLNPQNSVTWCSDNQNYPLMQFWNTLQTHRVWILFCIFLAACIKLCILREKYLRCVCLVKAISRKHIVCTQLAICGYEYIEITCLFIRLLDHCRWATATADKQVRNVNPPKFLELSTRIIAWKTIREAGNRETIWL